MSRRSEPWCVRGSARRPPREAHQLVHATEPVMMRVLRSAGLVFLLTVAGCLGTQAPLYPQVAATVPPAPPNQGRIYFYRDYEPYESLSRPYLYLNRQVIGISIPGGVFYRDVPPDTYEVSVYSVGAFPNQFKTIAVKPGDVFYAKIQSLRS